MLSTVRNKYQYASNQVVEGFDPKTVDLGITRDASGNAKDLHVYGQNSDSALRYSLSPADMGSGSLDAETIKQLEAFKANLP